MNLDSTYSLDGRRQSPNVPTRYLLTEPQQRQRVLELSVGLLIVRTELGEIWSEGFADVARFLDAVPLPTTDFRSAKSHLQNALRYCHAAEFGAATFELRVVRGIVERL